MKRIGATWILTVVVGFLAPWSMALGDGPFGVSMGDAVSTYTWCASTGQAGMYWCLSLPRALPEFDYFLLFATPETGVCRVDGVTKIIEHDSLGTTLRAKVDGLIGGIRSKYGNCYDKYDNLKPNYGSSERYRWLGEVWQGVARYFAYWTSERSCYVPVDNVDRIFVRTKALNRSRGYVQVSFEFTNYDACKAPMGVDKK